MSAGCVCVCARARALSLSLSLYVRVRVRVRVHARTVAHRRLHRTVDMLLCPFAVRAIVSGVAGAPTAGMATVIPAGTFPRRLTSQVRPLN